MVIHDYGSPFAVNGTWPCGHPRSASNTQRIGKAGLRCRECRRKITRESERRRRAAKAECRP